MLYHVWQSLLLLLLLLLLPFSFSVLDRRADLSVGRGAPSK